MKKFRVLFQISATLIIAIICSYIATEWCDTLSGAYMTGIILTCIIFLICDNQNDWINPKIQLPPEFKDVIVRLSDGSLRAGYYYYELNRWCLGGDVYYGKELILEWKYIN